MIITYIDSNGKTRKGYERPPQAFIDMAVGGGHAYRGVFAGRRLTLKGHAASWQSYYAWLDKRDEWSEP